ncbi:hypothetical protein BV898_08968 [Hypsibius exemplaris]|uniref:DUF985 domain-containing protein n=1 Tax=Hypsibius exemplaris TaxID=2072580 RepID=A0A1W0WP89_HYPEX|nr:hypothetical protein BV898_08968 [Hypsibius exemplaris]
MQEFSKLTSTFVLLSSTVLLLTIAASHQPDAAYWIQRLDLKPHPEGGVFKEFFRSERSVRRNVTATPEPAATSIYYLLSGRNFSAFHRIPSDEIWYFHKGSPLTVHIIDYAGEHRAVELSDGETGQLSYVVTANQWFAAEILAGEGFALVSCAVAPGFDFKDFELAKRTDLVAEFPQHVALFERLTQQ